MPVKRYALERGGSKRLEVSWRGNYNNLTFMCDGRVIGMLDTRFDFVRSNHQFTLPDGSTLNVWPREKRFGLGMDLYRGSYPLPGSQSWARRDFVLAFSALLFIALINLWLGISIQGQHSYYSDTSSEALVYYLYTFVFGVLGICTVLKYKVALGIAFGLYIADSVLMLLLLAANGVTSGATMLGFLLRGVLLVLIWRGFAALRALEYEELSSTLPVSNRTSEVL